MHLVINTAVSVYLDEAWRKNGRERRRGEQHSAEHLKRLGAAARCNRPHVPDDRALGVEIGGADQEAAPLEMLGCHLPEEFVGDVVAD